MLQDVLMHLDQYQHLDAHNNVTDQEQQFDEAGDIDQSHMLCAVTKSHSEISYDDHSPRIVTINWE